MRYEVPARRGTFVGAHFLVGWIRPPMTAISSLRVRPCGLDCMHMSAGSSSGFRERSWHREGAWRWARQSGTPVGGRSTSGMLLLFSFLTLFLSANAHSLDQYAQNRASLNKHIYYEAFRFLNSTKISTGKIYNASLSASVNDRFVELEAIQVVRLRTGSLKRRGIPFNEITLPIGSVVVQTLRYVVLVYRRFKQYEYYDSTNGTVFVAPVVGIMVYNYDNINNFTNNYGQELTVLASGSSPIKVQLQSRRDLAVEQQSCILYNNTVNGTATGFVKNVTTSAICSWNSLGDYALLGPPEHHSSNTWKIVLGSVVGGLAALIGLLLVGSLAIWYKNKAMFADMEHKSDQGEPLQHTWFGTSRAPSAAGTRTKPILENENV